MANETILLLQNPESPNVSVLTLLIRSGYVLHPTSTVDEALHRLMQVTFDLIIVNLDSDNAACPRCAELRAASEAPILLLGPIDNPEAIVSALANGADLYLPSTSAIAIIEAHIVAILRRTSTHTISLHTGMLNVKRPAFHDGKLTIDLERRHVTLNEAPVDLTPIEFSLLACLLENAGRPVPYEQLLTSVWGWETGDHSHVHTHISHLRKKLGDPPHDPHYILSEYGLGYRFQHHR